MQALVISPEPPRVRVVPDYATPSPQPGEALVRVHVAGICATDLEIVRGYLGFAGVPGHEFVGTVAGGPAELVGHRVVAEINCACRACARCRAGQANHCPERTVLGIAGRDGAFAECLTVPARNCHVVPDGIPDERAVFVEPLAAAAHVLDSGHFDASQRAAVLGTGRLGLLVAQVLAGQGCELTVVGRNPKTLALCARWGIRAVHVNDVQANADYDAVIDCTGAPDGLRLAMRLCRPCGTIVLKSTYAETAGLDLAPLVIHEFRLLGNRCGSFAQALQLLAERRVHVDELVTGVYPLAQGVEALAAAAEPHNIKILLKPGVA